MTTLRSRYDALNAQFFAGRLPAPDVLDWGARESELGSSGRRISDGALFVHLNPELAADLARLDQVLLHEMAHISAGERSGYFSSPREAHGRAFASEANRVGRALGVAEVRADSVEARHWPRREER